MRVSRTVLVLGASEAGKGPLQEDPFPAVLLSDPDAAALRRALASFPNLPAA